MGTNVQMETEKSKAPQTMNGALMLIEALKREKVEVIFGYPGGAVLPIYDKIYDSGLFHVLPRHEQGAIHAAEGYARVSGKPGVVIATSGPGATNVVTGVATAYMDSIPMVIISGQVPSTMVGTDAFQETDMIGISRPIVKHSFMIKHASEIPEVMKKAFYLAQSGRPGPVVVDVPKDMTNPAEKFEYVFPKKAKLRSYSPAVRGHSGQIRKAAEMLLAAKRPVLYSGGGVILGGGSAPLTELATAFAEEFGVTVEVQELPMGDIRSNLSVVGPTGEGPDIIVIAHDQAGTLVSNGLLAPVDALEGVVPRRGHRHQAVALLLLGGLLANVRKQAKKATRRESLATVVAAWNEPSPLPRRKWAALSSHSP